MTIETAMKELAVLKELFPVLPEPSGLFGGVGNAGDNVPGSRQEYARRARSGPPGERPLTQIWDLWNWWKWTQVGAQRAPTVLRAGGKPQIPNRSLRPGTLRRNAFELVQMIEIVTTHRLHHHANRHLAAFGMSQKLRKRLRWN